MVSLILAATVGFLLGVLLMILLFACREAEEAAVRVKQREKVKRTAADN
jgi:hypothetical protein